MRTTLALLAVASTLAACQGRAPETRAAHAPPETAAVPVTGKTAAPAPDARKLDADATLSTASGATFLAAQGWTVRTGDVTVLTSPEGDLTVTLADLDEPDADRAIARAWKLHDARFALPVRRRDTLPPKDGWEANVRVEYETPAAERRIVLALARRFGGRQHVALVEGTEAGVDRRAAQMMTTLTGYKPKGLVEEVLSGRVAKPLDAARLAELVAFADRARAKSGIPGAAIAVVQQGKVVLTKGLGVREAGKREPVTPKTLFMIGSTTKSLTTLMMAKLVDTGAFGWDTPVRTLDPQFALGDATATEKITMRHTVCACTGLPRQDLAFVFEYGDVTPEAIVRSLAGMKPTTGFGETFQYSNILVASGGYVAARAVAPKKMLGPAYDEALRTHVLAPLGMSSSTCDMNEARAREHATPHAHDRNLAYAPAPLGVEGFASPVRPAGAMWSNADEMTRVLQLELAKGKLDGRAIVSEANLLARRKPQVRITEKMAYGLGLFVEEDHGLAVVGHGGNTQGFTSDMFFLPEVGIGMVVLTNAGSANAYRRAVRRKLLEIVFDARPEAEEHLAAALEREAAAVKQELERVSPAASAALLASVAGTWTHPELGRVVITKDLFDAGEWRSRFSEKTEKDGVKKLFLLDPPFLGFEVEITKGDGGASLVVAQGQERYVLARAR